MQNENARNVVQLAKEIELKLRDYLNSLEKTKAKWFLADNPVRTKNLEKIAGHLQSLLIHLDPSADDQRKTTSISALLEQIKNPHELASNSAWELADLLEIELIRCGDDPYLYAVLKAQQNPGSNDAHRWDRYFSNEDLQKFLEAYSNGKFSNDYSRVEAKQFLEYIHQARISEYRRDRAKVQLRGNYLGRMALFLILSLVGLCVFYMLASQTADTRATGYRTYLLLLVAWAGATGSILSRAIKLGKQPVHSDSDHQAGEPPLGIRALISGWKVFLAQPVIGAASALILFFVFYSGLLQIGGVQELSPAGFAIIGFLAGFSEPFFIGILDKVAGQGGGTLN
ncbi:MAG: hypothetical protein ACREOO_05965 [bacterium]